jgi:hypothetical protein
MLKLGDDRHELQVSVGRRGAPELSYCTLGRPCQIESLYSKIGRRVDFARDKKPWYNLDLGVIEVLNVKVGVDLLSVLLKYYFSRHYSCIILIPDCMNSNVKIKPLYLTHYVCRLTSNTITCTCTWINFLKSVIFDILLLYH